MAVAWTNFWSFCHCEDTCVTPCEDTWVVSAILGDTWVVSAIWGDTWEVPVIWADTWVVSAI